MYTGQVATKYNYSSFQGLPELGEIYPIGGAGDRLGLVNPDTGECLPAALLPYCGRTLLEGLIRDLQVNFPLWSFAVIRILYKSKGLEFKKWDCFSAVLSKLIKSLSLFFFLVEGEVNEG